MFASGEQGGWYDPSNLSTLFQDSAFTAPVTAVEQPVGSMLDLSGRGNHASMVTTPKRPVLSRRVNLLPSSSSGIGVAPWGVAAGNPISTSGTGVIPVITISHEVLDGESVNRIQLSIGGGTSSGDRSGMYLNTNTVGRLIVWVKSLDATSSTVLAQSLFYNTTGLSVIESQGDGWVRVSAGLSQGIDIRLQLLGNRGLNSADFLVGKMSLILPSDAHLPYQRVNTDTEYDADPAKFPAYLRFDGVDDALQTGNIDFTGTDKMTVWAGVTKLSDAAVGVVAELSDTGDSIGVFNLYASATGSSNLGFRSKGTAGILAIGTGYIAPITAVLAGIGGISEDRVTLRVNSVQAAQSSADQGTGNYGNHPLYIGARAGTSLFFNGRLYSLIVRGAQSSLSQIEAGEAYIKQKMRLP